jgi:hypothetical protein
MEKIVALALNRFPVVPHSLREVPQANAARGEFAVPLASLYHHYYLDSHGKVPPNPDPAQFEHLQFLLPSNDFRVQGDGIGASTSIRRFERSPSALLGSQIKRGIPSIVWER